MLQQLCALLAVSQLNKESGEFLIDGYMTGGSASGLTMSLALKISNLKVNLHKQNFELFVWQFFENLILFYSWVGRA